MKRSFWPILPSTLLTFLPTASAMGSNHYLNFKLSWPCFCILSPLWSLSYWLTPASKETCERQAAQGRRRTRGPLTDVSETPDTIKSKTNNQRYQGLLSPLLEFCGFFFFWFFCFLVFCIYNEVFCFLLYALTVLISRAKGPYINHTGGAFTF